MIPSHSTFQQKWVLLSASADQPFEVHAPQLNDSLLYKNRTINKYYPSLLHQRTPNFLLRPRQARLALLLIGEMRCLSRSGALLKNLQKRADLYIVTTSKSSELARKYCSEDKLIVIEEHATMVESERLLTEPSMRQWHKLDLALKLVKKIESKHDCQYTHLVKIRSDYFFVHPERIFQNILDTLNLHGEGLVGSSDKIFAGSRDLMMLLQGFFASINGWFDQREKSYWPINLQQVLLSDDAIKWYGMNWPVELIGRPTSTEEWRKRLDNGGKKLANSLACFKARPNTEYHRLFMGHPRFASEVCFARFLNFTNIPFHDCYGLRGFLYSDRNMIT